MQEKIIKIVTFCLILVLGFVSYRAIIIPKALGLKIMQDTLRNVDTQLKSLLGEEVILRKGAVQQEAILRQLEELSQLIPSEKDIPRIMDDIITGATKGLNVDFQTIQPQEIKPEGKYKRFPIKLKFTCNYFDFSSYLANLSRLSTIIIVDSLQMIKNAENPDNCDVDLGLSAFVMPEEVEVKEAEIKEKTPASLLINPFSEKEKAALPVVKGIRPSVREPELRLQGVWEGREVSAFINGKIVKVGDYIKGFEVSRIQEKEVVLTKQGKRYILKIENE